MFKNVTYMFSESLQKFNWHDINNLSISFYVLAIITTHNYDSANYVSTYLYNIICLYSFIFVWGNNEELMLKTNILVL